MKFMNIMAQSFIWKTEHEVLGKLSNSDHHLREFDERSYLKEGLSNKLRPLNIQKAEHEMC